MGSYILPLDFYTPLRVVRGMAVETLLLALQAKATADHHAPWLQKTFDRHVPDDLSAGHQIGF
jgi:hypothetical protein